MKKVCLFFSFIAIAMVGYAQSAGNFGVEINLNNPFTNTDFFVIDGLKVRYFLSDDMVIRGTLNIESESSTDKTYNSDDKLVSTEKSSTSVFGITPGIELHIAKFEKGSVYLGGELGFGIVNVKSSETFSESSFGTDWNAKNGGTVFGLGVFTGVDYYLTNNIYLGAEVGLSYTFISISRGETTVGSTTTNGNSSHSLSNFGFAVNPALRLGWRF